MFGALSIVTIGVDLFEACAGVCLIAGLGLLGASLPHLA